MEMMQNLAFGFAVVLTTTNLFYCFVGVLLGTAIGVLPGLGPLAAIALLLPFTFSLDAVPSLIMLSGIFYGAQYGGSTTAILVNLPGEASSIVTALDGYQMARQGFAGKALATAAIGSFVAGCIATLLIGMFAPFLSQLAFRFGPAEYFALMTCGLVVSITLASGSLLKSTGMMISGIGLSLVGIDVFSGISRFGFGVPELSDGISVAAIAMGIFGLSEIVRNLETGGSREMHAKKVTGLLLTWTDIKRITFPILRGTGLGAVLGLLPGGGALLASFGSYALERSVSDHPERFGKGAIEGVAGPEAANNAGAQTSFVPMLTLGIPSNPVMALMIGAMIIQGIEPGPRVIQQQPELFWGIIASMWVGNIILLVLNLPLVSLWARIATVPYRFLFPAIIVFASVGVFAMNGVVLDVTTMAVFGILGYVFMKLGCEVAPLILGFVLGPIMEANLRRSMILSDGDLGIFFTSPISVGLLAFSAISLVLVMLPRFGTIRDELKEEA